MNESRLGSAGRGVVRPRSSSGGGTSRRSRGATGRSETIAPKRESPSRRFMRGAASWLGARRKPAELLAANPRPPQRTATSAPRLLPVVIGSPIAASSLPAGSSSPPAASHVEVTLPGGVLIRVPAQETAALRTVLELLEARSF